jgi:hypothetical protein
LVERTKFISEIGKKLVLLSAIKKPDSVPALFSDFQEYFQNIIYANSSNSRLNILYYQLVAFCELKNICSYLSAKDFSKEVLEEIIELANSIAKAPTKYFLESENIRSSFANLANYMKTKLIYKEKGFFSFIYSKIPNNVLNILETRLAHFEQNKFDPKLVNFPEEEVILINEWTEKLKLPIIQLRFENDWEIGLIPGFLASEWIECECGQIKHKNEENDMTCCSNS